jgi:uncharacterized protein (DUF2267 family)
MQCSDFMKRLRQKAGLTPEGTKEDVKAVLGTLAERIGRKERENLATWLPREFKPLFFQWREPEEFGVQEFRARVRERVKGEASRTIKLIRAVISVLKECVSPEEWEELLMELLPEYREFFEKEGEGESPVYRSGLTKGANNFEDGSGWF